MEQDNQTNPYITSHPIDLSAPFPEDMPSYKEMMDAAQVVEDYMESHGMNPAVDDYPDVNSVPKEVADAIKTHNAFCKVLDERNIRI